MASANIVIGKVGSLTGTAYARNEIGQKRPLKLGDEVYQGDLVFTDAGGRVEIDFGVGRSFAVVEGQQVVMDTTIYGDGEVEATRLAVLERDAQFRSIETQIASGTQSLDSLLEATASGGGAGAENYSRANLPALGRLSEGANLSEIHFAPTADNNGHVAPEGRAAALPAGQDTHLSVQSVTAAQVLEGGNLVHTVVLNHSVDGIGHIGFALNLESASTSDIGNISFSHGVTLQDGQLAIPAGVSVFSISIATNADRLAEGSETLSLTVGGVSVQDSIVDNGSMRLAAPAFAWHLAEPVSATPNSANPGSSGSLQGHDLISPADPLAQFLGHAATPTLATGHHELAALLAPGLALHEVQQQHTPA
jgi:hypothetical protein